jgi:hypothetical protein
LSGPCIAQTGDASVEVFSRASDGNIYRRPYDGSKWSPWAPLVGLGETTDARSDLDCAATTDAKAIHIVATGLHPPGALLHTFGAGTTYNSFTREIEGEVFDASPAISPFGFAAVVGGWPRVYQTGDTATPKEISPITTRMGWFVSSPDIGNQPTSGGAYLHFAGFDDTGSLAIYPWVVSAGGFSWSEPVRLSAPSETFAFSPTICVEKGGWGVVSLNVATVSAGKLWYARSDSITSPFSSWTKISDDASSSPDCVVGGAESVVRVVVLNAARSVVEIHGSGTSWVTTDLGSPR